MTHEQKANELVEKFLPNVRFGKTMIFNADEHKDYAKQCAIIAVNEILKSIPREPNNTELNSNFPAYQFWQQVKNHLIK